MNYYQHASNDQLFELIKLTGDTYVAKQLHAREAKEELKHPMEKPEVFKLKTYPID